MNLAQRIQAFTLLGKAIGSIKHDVLASLCDDVQNQNPWFIPENIKTSLAGISRLLEAESLQRWVDSYSWPQKSDPKTIGLTLAGNIPLVGFHDVLCVLISGNTAMIKQSSKDSLLLPFVMDMLFTIEPGFRPHVQWVQQLKNFDAVIATGSDNSARYFEYYFGKYPSIIRRNRTSCALLSGNESQEEIKKLGVDIFSYFGLGCRNVSKLFLPEGFRLTTLMDGWSGFQDIIHHHKYFNNYEYQKAIMLMNKMDHLDNGFVLLTHSEKLVSPIAVVYYEYYHTYEDVKEKLDQFENKIQCVVGNQPPATIPFGEAQYPGPSDYADNADTIQFILSLKQD